MSVLWCMSEEQVSLDIVNLYKWVCDKKSISIKISQITFNYLKVESKLKGSLCFEIKGIESDKYDKFIYSLVSRDGNGFVDYLFYEGDEFPKENDKPIAVAEATKNSGDEAGNMVDQRSIKPIAIFEKWGNVPFAYLISNYIKIDDTLKSFSQVHNCGFASMIGISKLANSDLDIIITQIDQIGYEKYKVPFEYNSIGDIIKQENLKKSSRGVPSRVFHRDGEIYIQANLLNGTSSSHDPGIGYVSSRSYLIRKLDDNIKINIIGHRRDDLFFNKTDNKLINVLKLTGVTIQFENDECIIIERESGLYDKSYWRYSTTGEKIASILMEKIYENNGYKVIFTNHAGCGKSYVKINDEFFQTTGGSGLPDLVLYKSETNELIVIEGETSNNYQKGLKQVKDQNFNDFIQREFINRLPIGLTIKKYLCTYGDYKNEPEVLFNLNDKFEITINENVISIE